MTAKESATPEVHTLLTGIAFGESYGNKLTAFDIADEARR